LSSLRRQISDIPSPGKLYSDLMDLIIRFAQAGLIHGDFNEFNILIYRETGEPVVIDFPQMVSTSHLNAEWWVNLPSYAHKINVAIRYFNRDVECIRAFFRRRFRYESNIYPKFSGIDENSGAHRLDVVVAASGFTKQEADKLETVRNYLNFLTAVDLILYLSI
jgi:RIO kinase 2